MCQAALAVWQRPKSPLTGPIRKSNQSFTRSFVDNLPLIEENGAPWNALRDTGVPLVPRWENSLHFANHSESEMVSLQEAKP